MRPNAMRSTNDCRWWSVRRPALRLERRARRRLMRNARVAIAITPKVGDNFLDRDQNRDLDRQHAYVRGQPAANQ